MSAVEVSATYTVTVTNLTVRPPSQFLSHHSVRIKWSHGERKGKLPPLRLLPAHVVVEPHIAGGLPLIHIPPCLLASQVLTLDSRFSEKGAPPLTLEVILIKYSDPSHTSEKSKVSKGAISIPADNIERSLYHRAKPHESRLTNPHEGLTVSFDFVKEEEENEADDEPSTSTFPLEAADLPDDESALDSAGDRMRAALAAATSDAGDVVVLRTVTEQGLFKAVNCSLGPTEAAAQLFFPPPGFPSVLQVLHERRGDAEYSESRWRHSGADRSVMHRTVQYSLKAAGTRFVPATEHAFVCAVGDDIIGRAINYSPAAPFVGSALKLETVLHITGDGDGGCVIGLYVYAAAPDTARRMLGSKLDRQIEKLLSKAEMAISDKVPLSTTQLRERSRQSYMRAKVRLSMGMQQGITVDGLWRKLLDPLVLRQEQFILQYLSQLTLRKQLSVSDVHVATLESVLVYHRGNLRVVNAVLSTLLSLCRVSSSAYIGGLSTTLHMSINSVFALYPADTFSRFEDLLYQMEHLNHQTRRAQCEELVKSKNLWGALEKHCGNREGCISLLGAMQASSRRRIQSDQWSTLVKVVALHIDSDDIVKGVFLLMKVLDTPMAAVPSRAVDVLHRACVFHKFTVLEIIPEAMSQLEKRQRGFSKFDRRFAVLEQHMLFECKGCLTSPKVAVITIYVTAASIILGDFVLPLVALRVVQRYKARFFQSGVRFVVGAGDIDFSVIVPSREALLHQIQQLEGVTAQFH
jgi:hypothetical protein